MEELKSIAQACTGDQRIYDIVVSIANMTEEEKSGFKSKVLAYFINRKSPDDVEAYKFYKLLLENQNAKKVLDLYVEITENK